MNHAQQTKSAAVRSKLKHPVIDSDGHSIEFEPGILAQLESVGGRRLREQFSAWGKEGLFRWHQATVEERLDKRIPRTTWWGMPTKNTLDRVTASLPNLFYQRLDEFGIDVAILYPTFGLPVPHIEDEELRKGSARAFNSFYAETYEDLGDRLIPAGIIPMHTPQEAIEELEYATKVLGLKTFMFPSFIERPIPAIAREFPSAAGSALYLDMFGLDSPYDYDPVWAKCVELGVTPSFHSSGFGWGSRVSPSNYMFNHLGMFGAAGEGICRSLFMGGVTRRFPRLKFAFLEGGAGWACNLYADLIGHWEKRNINALQNYDPANLDRELMIKLYKQYGGKMVEGKLGELDAVLGLLNSTKETPEMLDEWAACEIDRVEDIYEIFIPNFYFGCEADDATNSWAFNTGTNPFGARLRVLFGSDIGHWDVPEATDVVEEAYEMVEHNRISEEDFRDFVFANPVSFYASLNAEFFKGTVVETEAEQALAAGVVSQRNLLNND
jgi:predicted TIM-barrel fold metal-dependent hydrolase